MNERLVVDGLTIGKADLLVNGIMATGGGIARHALLLWRLSENGGRLELKESKGHRR